MITSLVKTTVRYTAGSIRLATRTGLWLTRTLASMAFNPPERDCEPAPEPYMADGQASRSAPSKPETTEPETTEPETNEPEAAGPGVPGRDVPPERAPDPHHALNVPVGDPDPTEWPDPYDQRPDPRDPVEGDELPIGDVPHTPPGAVSTSEPHPSQDPEAEPWEGPKRDKVDE